MTREEYLERLESNIVMKKWSLYEIDMFLEKDFEFEGDSGTVEVDGKIEVGKTPGLGYICDITAATLNGAIAGAKAEAVAYLGAHDECGKDYLSINEDKVDGITVLAVSCYNKDLDEAGHFEFAIIPVE